MVPVFLLQIVRANPPYDAVRLPAGGALERDLVAAVAEGAAERLKGRWWSRPTAERIREAVAAALDAVLTQTKKESTATVLQRR